MHKLRALLPGQSGTNNSAAAAQRQSVNLAPEIGFQITIECSQQQTVHPGGHATVQRNVPELNVHLIAARHLPALFGFKIVHGYLVKVKMFPGSKRLDSSIQTNSWPKFNENFKFPLAPDLKPSLKHSSRRGSKSTSEFTPEDLFAGQFVVFTVYALLELPPASLNRLSKTYRSLRDKSSNLVQKIAESSAAKTKDGKENVGNGACGSGSDTQKVKRKPSDVHPRDAIPPLTISESRRNLGSVTCYLEPKLFKRNSRNGQYSTDELWLPIKDITVSKPTNNNNSLANSTKGVIELALEVRDLSMKEAETSSVSQTSAPTTPTTPTPPTTPTTAQPESQNKNNNNNTVMTNGASNAAFSPTAVASNGIKNPQWNRMTSEVRRKMGISNTSKLNRHDLVLCVTTTRMRCSNKVKDELEHTAGSVYVKTTVFEHGIYVDSWKSPNFYPSLSTKWDVGDNSSATLRIPLLHLNSLEHVLIRTTLATKTKMGKKLVLGTVLIGAAVHSGSGAEHMQLLRETPTNERVAVWHSYQ